MVDEPKNEEMFDGIRIIGDEAAADDVAPGRSVFDGPADDEANLPSWAPEPEASKPATDPNADWSSINRDGPRWAETPEAAEPVAAAPVGEGGDEFFGFDDGDNDSFSKFDEKVPDFNPSLMPPEAEPAGSADPIRIGGDVDTAAPLHPQGPASVVGAPQAETPAPAGEAGGGDRNLTTALGTAAVLAGVALLCWFIGPVAVMLLATAILGLAAAEFFNAVRPAGYNPPALLGIVGVVSMSVAAYWRGESSIPLVLVLTMIFGALWYLTGVSSDRPTANLSVTLLGMVWIGVMGSYAALMLAAPNGRGMLFAALACTVAYDTGAWAVGRAAGRQPLSPTSPNKTIEGLIGGTAFAVVAAILLLVFDVEPFGGDEGGIIAVLLLGIVVAIVAPLGDLTESLFKRDLGLKDMGSFLPGHGGVLDRFDALLFVLPAVYLLARMLFDFV